MLRRSIALWLPPAEDDADGGCASGAPGGCVADVPSFEFRFETAKLLVDLDDSTATAVRVLEGLLEECDDRPQVWFLLALAHHGACAFERARGCLTEAEEVRRLLCCLLRHRVVSSLMLPSFVLRCNAAAAANAAAGREGRDGG